MTRSGSGEELLDERLQLAPGSRGDEAFRVGAIDLFPQAHTPDERHRIDPVRMIEGHLGRDGSAHGVTNDVGGRDLHRVQEASHEARQIAECLARQSAVRLAVARQIQRHDRVLLGQRIDVEEPVVEVAPEAMKEQHTGAPLPLRA